MAAAERRRRLRRDEQNAGQSLRQAAGPGASAENSADGTASSDADRASVGPLLAKCASAPTTWTAPAPGSVPPWLAPEVHTIAQRIVAGHAAGFGTALMAPVDPAHLAAELFALDTLVLAHDGADPDGDPGPRLIYANAAALRLWRRPWAEQIGLPSRLTAEPQERAGRARMLVNARQEHALTGYTGIRIDSQGRRFQIRNARLWTLRDDNGTACGQAAAFSDWWWL